MSDSLRLELFEQLNGELAEDIRFLALARGRRAARGGGFADRRPQRDAAEKWDSHHPGRRLGPARAERLADLAAMRAGIARHVLDQAERLDPHLAEHVDRPG